MRLWVSSLNQNSITNNPVVKPILKKGSTYSLSKKKNSITWSSQILDPLLDSTATNEISFNYKIRPCAAIWNHN